MTRHFDYCPSASESSAPVVSRSFPDGYNVKLYISRGRLAWWLLAFLCCVQTWYAVMLYFVFYSEDSYFLCAFFPVILSPSHDQVVLKYMRFIISHCSIHVISFRCWIWVLSYKGKYFMTLAILSCNLFSGYHHCVISVHDFSHSVKMPLSTR